MNREPRPKSRQKQEARPDATEEVLRKDLIERVKDGEVLDRAKFMEESVSELRRFSEGKGRQPENEQIQKARESAGRIFDEIMEQDRHLKEVQKKLNKDEIDLKVIERANEIGEKEINLVAYLKDQLNVRETEIRKIEEFSPEVCQDNLNQLQSMRTRLSDVFKRANEAVKKVATVKNDVAPLTSATSVESTSTATPTTAEKKKAEKPAESAVASKQAVPETSPERSQPPTEPPTPEKQKIKNIDLPASLLTEILLERPDDFKDMMRAAYNHALEGGGEVKIKMLLKGLFAKEPSEELLKQLAKYGISGWTEFNDALKGDIGDNVSVVLGEMIKEQVNRDVARVISRWKNMWALKGDVGKSIAINMVLVSGGVISLNILANLADKYTAGFGSKLLGAGDSVRRAAVGGFVGGTIRGWLQQKVFGSKEAQEKSASKIQAMHGASAKELVDDLMSEGYDEINIEERINEMGGVFAQVLRASSQTKTDGEPKELGDLSHNARAQYLEIIKQLEDSGENLKERGEEKIELILLLAKLEKAGEDKVNDWADEKKGEVPVVIQILGGSLKKFFGAMGGKSSKYPKLIAGAVGALVGTAFWASSLKARLILGGAGGVLQGIESARDKLGKKGEEEAIANLNAVLESAYQELRELQKLENDNANEYFIEDQVNVLNKEVEYFRVMKRGERDKEAALALAKNPTLLARVDNFIYEAEKKMNQRELQKEKQKEKRLAKLITRLEEAGENVARESKKKKTTKEIWDKINKTWGEYGIRMLVGGAVGAGAAAALGWGFLKGKAAAMGWLKGDEAVGQPQNVDAKAAVAGAVAGAEAKSDGTAVPSPEPEAKPAPVEIPPAPTPAPPTPIEAAPISEPAQVPEVPRHTGDFDFAHPENDSDLRDFVEGRNVTANGFDYLKYLTEKFPELNNRESLEKILDSGEYHDGKHSASPDVYKGTINTPIEAAADSRFSTFDAILREGGAKRAVEFLKSQDFNEHDLSRNLKLTGSLTGDELDSKLEELVKAYQNGDNKAGKRVFDALRHDQNRVIAAYEVVDKKGIGHLPIKSAGKGLDPRVLGDFNGKLLVEQARGYGVKWEAPAPTSKPIEGDIQPREFEFGDKKAYLGGAGKEFVPNEKGEMWSEAEVDKPKAVVEVSQDTVDLIKARAGNSAYFQETIKQPDGHVIEYNFNAGTGEVIAYDVTAGSVAAGTAVEHALSSRAPHAPRPVEISELWTPSRGGGGGGAGGGGGGGASGGGGVAEQAKGGGGGVPRVESPAPTHKPILSAEQKQMADYLEKTGSEARGRTEVTDKTGKTYWQEEKVGKTVGQKTVESTIETTFVKQEYSRVLSEVKNELQDKLLGLIMDDSRTQTQGNEIISLLDGEIINASAGSSADSSLLEIVKHNFGSNKVDMYDKVMSGLSDKLSLEQEFLFKGVPETVIKFNGLLVGAATDAPTHLLKYHSNDGWHARYDPDYLYSLSDKTLQIFDARTGLPVEGGGNAPRVK